MQAFLKENALLTRRTFIALAVLAGGMPALAHARTDKKTRWTRDSLATFQQSLAKLEAASRGRLGVALLDVGSGQAAGYRADERF